MSLALRRARTAAVHQASAELVLDTTQELSDGIDVVVGSHSPSPCCCVRVWGGGGDGRPGASATHTALRHALALRRGASQPVATECQASLIAVWRRLSQPRAGECE